MITASIFCSVEFAIWLSASVAIVVVAHRSWKQSRGRVLTIDVAKERLGKHPEAADAFGSLKEDGEYWDEICKLFAGLLVLQPIVLAILGFESDSDLLGEISGGTWLLVPAVLVIFPPVLVGVARIGPTEVGRGFMWDDYAEAAKALKRKILSAHVLVAIACVAYLGLLTFALSHAEKKERVSEESPVAKEGG